MIINQKQMDEINAVQYEIFKAFHSVCEQLRLRYYLVHGSALGALRHHGFFPMDDDIDVAMPRHDYDILMKEGQQYIGNKYFVQSYLSEVDYPLVFGKIRDKETAFIQPVLSNFNVNQGIYIDVFPIDNYPVSNTKINLLKRKSWFSRLRVEMRFKFERKTSFKSKLFETIALMVFPSWKKARNVFCSTYDKVPYTGIVIVRGGKRKEVGMPFELFGKPTKIVFEGIESYIPERISDYLELIYGDYMNYEPMGKDMVSESEVKISADIFDTKKPYTAFIGKS